MVPSHLEVIPALPTLPSGKVDRARAPGSRAGEHSLETIVSDSGARYPIAKSPSVARGRTLAPLPVTIDDDFFRDLGGHSLLAAQMVSRLRVEPGFAGFSVLDVYEHPTPSTGEETGQRSRCRGRRPRRATSPEQSSVFALRIDAGRRPLLHSRFLFVAVARAYLTYTYLVDQDESVLTAITGALVTLIGVYPVMMTLAVVVKWTIVGRFKAGKLPALGWAFLRPGGSSRCSVRWCRSRIWKERRS